MPNSHREHMPDQLDHGKADADGMINMRYNQQRVVDSPPLDCENSISNTDDNQRRDLTRGSCVQPMSFGIGPNESQGYIVKDDATARAQEVGDASDIKYDIESGPLNQKLVSEDYVKIFQDLLDQALTQQHELLKCIREDWAKNPSQTKKPTKLDTSLIAPQTTGSFKDLCQRLLDLLTMSIEYLNTKQ